MGHHVGWEVLVLVLMLLLLLLLLSHTDKRRLHLRIGSLLRSKPTTPAPQPPNPASHAQQLRLAGAAQIHVARMSQPCHLIVRVGVLHLMWGWGKPDLGPTAVIETTAGGGEVVEPLRR